MGDFSDFTVTKCHKIGCRDMNHLAQIEQIYDKIICSINVASQNYVRKQKKINKFKIIPGWNRRVKGLHNIARENYQKWIQCGRSRESPEFQSMVSSKKAFKKALNECKRMNTKKYVIQ